MTSLNFIPTTDESLKALIDSGVLEKVVVQKTKNVSARKGVVGEEVVTLVDGGELIETKNTVKNEGDMVVSNIIDGKANSYVVKAEKFEKLYSSTGENGPYKPVSGPIDVFILDRDVMIQRPDWGDSGSDMKLRKGAAIVAESNGKFYGINPAEFEATYTIVKPKVEKELTGEVANEEKKEKFDPFQEVTNKIISAIENGTSPWQKPWQELQEMGAMRNAVFSNVYQGINQMMLTIESMVKGYTDPRWCTFKQAKDKGWNVKKGELGTQVCRYVNKTITDKDKLDDNGEPIVRTIPILKLYSVFNAAQLDPGPELLPATEVKSDFQVNKVAEDMLVASQAKIGHGGNKAFYSVTNDSITLPPKESFNSETDYYGVALHELGHWTGDSKRMDRDLSGKFGDKKYAFEELVGELISAFMSQQLGLPGRMESNAAYIKTWLSILQEDKKAIFKAATLATRGSNYIVELTTPKIEAVNENGLVEKPKLVEAPTKEVAPTKESAAQPEEVKPTNKWNKSPFGNSKRSSSATCTM